jgi:RNA polymerase sigma-70 factor (sigma-E family)
MKAAEEQAYREFVALRMESLRRMAFLLCRDWHTADDLVSITIGKLYRHWGKVSRAENVDAYVRGVLTHAWLDERRRPWRREDPTADLPESSRPTGRGGTVESDLGERQALLDLLAELPPRRRAVLVLRFYCDLSVAETAEILGVNEGTVKSQAARGLETLRLLVTESYAIQEAR